MSYTLFYSPGAASLAVHWMLLELGVAFEARRVDLDKGEQHSAEYLRINPSGRVPALIIDGKTHFESAALLMLLAERHPEHAWAPLPNSATRADWLQAMIHLANGVLPPMRDWFYADKDGAAADAEPVRRLARQRIESAWTTLDSEFSDARPYLLGDTLSTADLLATMLMRWSRNMPRPATTWPHLGPYVTRMRARPAFIEVCRREGLTEWLND